MVFLTTSSSSDSLNFLIATNQHSKQIMFNSQNNKPFLDEHIPVKSEIFVLFPLLDLAGFYLPPFHIKSEKSIEIADQDE